MDLIVYFNKKILGSIRSKLSEITNMHSISIVHFCSVIIQKISREGLNAPVDEHLVSMLCQIFDCVDVDSRGFINWEDFVSFALRSGRNSFKPISGYVNVDYMQRMDVSAVIPVKKLYYSTETNLLYAFDGDSPLVRCIRRSGEVVNVFNPVVGITRLIKVRQQGKQPYFAKKNTAKQDAGKLKKKKDNVLKQTVTSMTWIDRKRQMVFATSNSCLSFWNSRLVHLIDFVDTTAPQLGMLYSNIADVLLTWAGDKANYDYSVWDCNSRTLRYQFNLHRSIILTTVEISCLGAIISSSMDRSLYVWPISKLLQSDDASFDDKKLVGHTYAIRSVCFAPQNDLIIGAGFDFDIFCWDPTTSSLQMKLVGHRQSLVSVAVINNPFERAASVDESGSAKIWNIDRAQGLRGTLLQSIVLQGAVPNHVFSFISAFDNGAVLACLSEKLLFIELTSTAMEDNRLVTGGLSICEQNSRIVVTSRKNAFEFSLANGDPGKVYTLISEDCIETCTTAKFVSGVELKRATNSDTGDDDEAKGDRRTSDIAISVMNKGSRNMYPEDDLTCVTCAQGGKKFYAGTNSGRVLLYDGTSLGLLSQLSHEEKICRRDDHNSGGAVVQLKYCERDEILVAAFAGGAVKVFNGCHRVVTEDITTALQTKAAEDIEELLCPYFQGGGPPKTPLLLRVNERVHETTVMAMDVSDKLGLIAVSGVDGTVRVFDYHTLLIRSIFAAPFVGSQPVEVINLSFLPLAPILIGADSNGRFTAWTVYPMSPLWILTWSLQTCFSNTYNMNSEEKEKATEEVIETMKSESVASETDVSVKGKLKRASSLKRRSSTETMNSFQSLEDDGDVDSSNNTVVSSMQCVVWKTCSRAIKTATSAPNRVNWNIVVGEGNGMISIIDLTDVMEKMGLHDFNQLKQAYRLSNSAMVYQTIRRTDIKDGLEDFQIREIEKRVRHPIGYNCFSNSRHGFKNISNKDVKGVVRWNAHTHGVGEIVCKQYLSPYQMHSRSQQKEFKAMNANFRTQDYENIPGSPYVVVSSSEYGVPKRWSWSGQPLSDDYGGDMLQQAISLNTKINILDDMELKEKDKEMDLDGLQDFPSQPSGGAAQRLATVVEWAMPFIKTRLSQARSQEGMKSGLLQSPQPGRDTASSPTEEKQSSQHNATGGGVISDDEDEDEDEESTSMNLFSTSKNKQTGGISGHQTTPFVEEDIIAIRRKVNEDKRRRADSDVCWNAKDRFPNQKSEIKKNERRHKDVNEEEVQELLVQIEEVKMIPESESTAVLLKSYSSFVSKRDELHSAVNRKLKKHCNAAVHKKKEDKVANVPVMEGDITSSYDGNYDNINGITDRELFMCDIRQLRTTTSAAHSLPPSTPNTISRKVAKGQGNGTGGQTPNTKTPNSTIIKSKSGRRLLTKADSLLNFSREIGCNDLDMEDEEELKELGLTIKRRERVVCSRLQSISSIEATMSRFDKITSSDDKKYSYKFNHNPGASYRGKKKKTQQQKQSERQILDDTRNGSGAGDSQQVGSINSEAGAGRYGPYKGRDIAAFEDFMSRLPPIHAAVDNTCLDFRFGEYFPQILSSVQLGLVYEMSEILPIVMGMNNKSLTAMIKDLTVRLDGTFLREDLFLTIFAYASNCERIRIQKYAMIRAVLIDVFKGLNPPPLTLPDHEAWGHSKYAHGTPGGLGKHQSLMSPSKSRMTTNVLFTDIQNQPSQQSSQMSHHLQQSVSSPTTRKHFFPEKSIKSLSSHSEQKSLTPTATPAIASVQAANTATTPHKAAPVRQVKAATAGLEGWSLKRSILEELKLMFDDFFVDRNGTVVGNEIIEICQFACTHLNLDKPPDISFLALRRSFPVTSEVNGDLIAQFFEDVLRLEINDDSSGGVLDLFLSRGRLTSDASDVLEDDYEGYSSRAGGGATVGGVGRGLTPAGRERAKTTMTM